VLLIEHLQYYVTSISCEPEVTRVPDVTCDELQSAVYLFTTVTTTISDNLHWLW